MSDRHTLPNMEPPNTDGIQKMVEQAAPEVAEGPFGLPYVKPKGAPDLPTFGTDRDSGRGGR